MDRHNFDSVKITFRTLFISRNNFKDGLIGLKHNIWQYLTFDREKLWKSCFFN